MATNIYIDESGSMTNNSEEYKQPFFIISLIKVTNEKVLKRNLKRFISSNLKTLQKIDTKNKMFINGKFAELKGSALNGALKREFVEKITKDQPFELFYIKLYNNQIKPIFVENKARAFNFLLKLFFEHSLRNKQIKNDKLFLQIDERNIKTQAKNTLEDYLNTELILNDYLLSSPLQVKYFDSVNNKFIQVADVFANIYYSECLTNAYVETINKLKENNILKEIFVFPKKCQKNIDN